MKKEPESLFIVEVLLAAQATIPDKSPWDCTVIFLFFLSFLDSLLKQCILFEIFLQFSPRPPPPIQS